MRSSGKPSANMIRLFQARGGAGSLVRWGLGSYKRPEWADNSAPERCAKPKRRLCSNLTQRLRQALRKLCALGFRFLAEHLPATIHAGFKVDVVRPAQFPGILVLDISRAFEGIGRTPHAALGRRCFSFRHGHDRSPWYAVGWRTRLIEEPPLLR